MTYYGFFLCGLWVDLQKSVKNALTESYHLLCQAVSFSAWREEQETKNVTKCLTYAWNNSII